MSSCPASAPPAIRDGDGAARLRCDINVLTLALLPEWSSGPRRAVVFGRESAYRMVKESGFGGVQIQPPLFGSARLCHRVGLAVTVAATYAKLPLDGNLVAAARAWKRQGAGCATLIVGSGLEAHDDACRLVERVLQASTVVGLPLYVETHRASITDDPVRTLALVDRFPELRFNGDFSHWYLGTARTPADAHELLDILGPIIDRTRYLHGRIASTGRMQVPPSLGAAASTVAVYEELWSRVCAAFMRQAGPGEVLGFAVELLTPWQGYAPVRRDERGRWRESGDRWEEAIALAKIARRCFETAERAVTTPKDEAVRV